MITPRRTRLVRVPDLHAFRHAIRENVAQAFGAVVVVPTKSAARQLGTGVTRDELYAELRSRLTGPPRLLTAIERDVIAQAAARAVADTGAPLAFQLRAGLVAEMLRFYDHLRRQSQLVARFEALIADAVGDDDSDTGAARLRQQTRFLADTFREYERRVRETGACDEHLLRDRLVREAAADPIRHVVVTVGDWIADENGLYVADFDLLSRIHGLQVLDVIATEGILRSGFRERLDAWLPGLEDAGLGARESGFGRPVLIVPSNSESRIPTPNQWFTHRDREEELIAVTRTIEAPLERTAVVYKRPLPYLYLAGEVFGEAGIPHHASDALPLATEPTAAAFDLILESAVSDFTRESLVALLRSPHFAFDLDPREIGALDRALSEARYLGGRERLDAVVADLCVRQEPTDSSARAVAAHVAHALAPLQASRPASKQIRTLLEFWSAHARPLADDDPLAVRERRARAAIVGALELLATVHAEQGDPAWKIEDLSLAIRRAIEEQTFVPDSCERGLQLVDDQAARYGDFDDVFIVGLVEHEWPESPRRNIFYPSSLLKALGWPTERDRRAAADARFVDLLVSARRRTIVSTFTLDDDALVMPSLQLDEIPRARLSSVAAEVREVVPRAAEPYADAARQWVALRTHRSDAAAPIFHGSAGSQPPRPWSVSALETYLGCPFKFFAQHVLDLDEEPEDEEVMDPRRQGQLVHDVFERFFREWQAGGHGTITSSNLDAARELFEDVVSRALVALSPAEAGLERTRLLGSPAAAGLGEAVFRMEAERPARVVERLLEWRLEGSFVFSTADGTRELALKGKADRIDLLEDGSFRLIDYKLGWPPDRTRALQLPIYSVSAEQRLASYRGRSWTLGEAAYLAFKGPRRVVPLFAPGARDRVVADAQQRLVDAVDAIGRGEFPPTPDDVYRCETCAFATVCRRDYVGDV